MLKVLGCFKFSADHDRAALYIYACMYDSSIQIVHTTEILYYNCYMCTVLVVKYIRLKVLYKFWCASVFWTVNPWVCSYSIRTRVT